MRALVLAFALMFPAMAGREFAVGSSEFGAKTSGVTTYPVTISVWFYQYSTNTTRVCAFIGDSGATTRRFMLGVTSARAAVVDAIDNAGGAAANATTTTLATLNTWNHAIGVLDSATSRRVYLNGGGAATNTTSKTTTGLTTFAVGARNNLGTWGLHFDGVLAEVAVWSVALNADEIASLASGASPLLIRPASRVHYVPLTGQAAGSDWDLHGDPIGLTNTPAPASVHPRIYRP